ncbi:MFS transporter [Celerinatantimonas yamalensis]|uniref:MFS transporter n=1 Tax=Celerinatantimonas yamalensis TaxID=559956 RepID=A0ABW9G7Q4_9GAMM
MASQPRLPIFGLILLVAGQLLPQLDFSIVNVALSAMGHTLHTSATGLVLIVALYGLSFASLIATGARLGDRYGRKRIFFIGISGFALASALCGFANGLVMMLVGRLLQGLCGALLMPQIMATIHATLTGQQHSRAVSIYTSVAGLAVALGQMLGGWLVSANIFDLSWRIAFFINIPICLLVLMAGTRLIPETRATNTPTMDFAGMGLFTLLLLCILLPVTLAEHWPPLGILLLAAIPLGRHLWRIEHVQEQQGRSPLLPPSLFRNETTRTGFIGEAVVTFLYPGYLFVTALTLQDALAFSPRQSGDSFIALGLVYFLGSLLSRYLTQRFGNYRIFASGAMTTLLGLVLTTGFIQVWHTHISIMQLSIATGIVGLGNAMMLTAAFRMALAKVAPHHAGEASSALNTIQQGCFALGTAFAGAIYALMLNHGYVAALATTFGLLALLLIGMAYYMLKVPRLYICTPDESIS